jgi:hypothetical protein
MFSYDSFKWDRCWLEERIIECRPKSGRPRKTTLEQDMNIVGTGIFYKHDKMIDIMIRIRDVIELDINKSTNNSQLLSKFFSLELGFFGLKNKFCLISTT